MSERTRQETPPGSVNGSRIHDGRAPGPEKHPPRGAAPEGLEPVILDDAQHRILLKRYAEVQRAQQEAKEQEEHFLDLVKLLAGEDCHVGLQGGKLRLYRRQRELETEGADE